MPVRKLPARAIRDQDSRVNCCTSCALSACLEALRPGTPELSPVFHYRQSGGGIDSKGLTDLGALNGGRTHGFCLQSLHNVPISAAGIEAAVSDRAIESGIAHRLCDRRGRPLWQLAGAPDRPHSWKLALDRGHPLFVVIATDQNYLALENSGESWWKPTTAAPGKAGNHAVAVLGYDDREKCSKHFIIQDCWGPSFGLLGQWFLSERDAGLSNRITASYSIG